MPERARSLSGDAFVFLATLVIHGIPLPVGATIGPDDHLYAGIADQILRGSWSGVLDSSRLLWTKAIFIALVAAAKVVAPVGWRGVMVAMNVVCSAATATLIVNLVRRATGSGAAAGVAFLFYIFSFDLFFWTRFVMTDSLYTLLATAVFVLVARPIVDGRRPRSIVPLAACLVLATLTRPPGIVLAVPAVIGAVAFWPPRKGDPIPIRRRRFLWISVLVAMTALLLLRTYIVHDPARWPFKFIKPTIVQFATLEKSGEVVAQVPSTFRPAPATYGDHLLLQAARFIRFFQFVTPEFSQRHNLMDGLYFAPLYALALAGIAGALRTTDRKRRNLVWLLLLWVGVFAYYHAITVLVWRYRLPLMPQLIILAGCGAGALQSMMASRRAVTIESGP